MSAAVDVLKGRDREFEKEGPVVQRWMPGGLAAAAVVLAATACGLWMVSGTMPPGAAVWSVAGFLAAAWGAYMVNEAWSGRWWLRGGCYAAGVSGLRGGGADVCAAGVARGSVR